MKVRRSGSQSSSGGGTKSQIVTKDERNEHLRLAVRYAQALTRDAEKMLSWLEQYARQEGAID